MLFTVIETPVFIKRAAAVLTDEELDDLRYYVAENPDEGAVIKGSGGIRKLRFKSGGKGKRGGVRVITFVVTKRLEIFLLDVYAKSSKENLSADEIKELAKLTDYLKRE